MGIPKADERYKAVVADFRGKYVDSGNKSTTFDKNWRHIRTILRRLGPQQYRNPLGEEILARIPDMRPLPFSPDRHVRRTLGALCST